MKRIISVDGNKGGTGKSVTTTALLDTALECEKSVLFIEADDSHADVAKSYADTVETVPLKLNSGNGFIELIDVVHNSTADIIIINNGAQSKIWNEKCGGESFVKNLHRLEATMSVIWVADTVIESVELCADFFEKYKEIQEVKMYFCINEHNGPINEFSIWFNSNIRKKILESGGGEIVLCDSASRMMNAMKNQHLRWDQLEELEICNRFEAERFRQEFNEVFKPFVI